MMAAMRAIDSRLNRSTQESYSQRKATGATRGQHLKIEATPGLRMLPPSVPEDALLMDDAMGRVPEGHRIDMDSLLRGDGLEQKSAEDEALRAYMDRHAMLHGGALGFRQLGAGAPGKRAGGWNYN